MYRNIQRHAHGSVARTGLLDREVDEPRDLARDAIPEVPVLDRERVVNLAEQRARFAAEQRLEPLPLVAAALAA